MVGIQSKLATMVGVQSKLSHNGRGSIQSIDRVVAGEALLLRLPVYDGPREIGGGGVPLVMYPRGDPCI